MERKKSVEMRLEQQRKEREEYEAVLREKQNRDLRRAQSMKETREQEVALVRGLMVKSNVIKICESRWLRFFLCYPIWEHPHKPLRKIKVTICNHQADSPLHV